MLLHIGRRMKHHDATDFDMSIFELAADLLLDELVIGYSVFILAISLTSSISLSINCY